MTSSLVFYPEVGRFSLRSEAKLDKEKLRDFPLLQNFIHFSSQFWSDRGGLPDDKVFFVFFFNQKKQSWWKIVFVILSWGFEKNKTKDRGVLLFGVHNYKVVHIASQHNTYICIYVYIHIQKNYKILLKNYAVIRFFPHLHIPQMHLYFLPTFWHFCL